MEECNYLVYRHPPCGDVRHLYDGISCLDWWIKYLFLPAATAPPLSPPRQNSHQPQIALGPCRRGVIQRLTGFRHLHGTTTTTTTSSSSSSGQRWLITYCKQQVCVQKSVVCFLLSPPGRSLSPAGISAAACCVTPTGRWRLGKIVAAWLEVADNTRRGYRGYLIRRADFGHQRHLALMSWTIWRLYRLQCFLPSKMTRTSTDHYSGCFKVNFSKTHSPAFIVDETIRRIGRVDGGGVGASTKMTQRPFEPFSV